jgi:solute carrier family 25 (mitochondrial S-adenosylmethionine transporter), member 26
VVGAASGAGIAIGAYFAFYGAATNLLVRHSDLKRGQVAFVAGAAAAAGGSVVKVPLAVCIRCAQAEAFQSNCGTGASVADSATQHLRQVPFWHFLESRL